MCDLIASAKMPKGIRVRSAKCWIARCYMLDKAMRHAGRHVALRLSLWAQMPESTHAKLQNVGCQNVMYMCAKMPESTEAKLSRRGLADTLVWSR